ncbi:hypothetical protein C8R44DRAFT_869843 [Mycena epipterygia]|nr:hypothetical protein C8R44DRAFT_869843 [Mycena epipterygia]
MTRDELYEAAHRYEADRADTQHTECEAQRDALADITNADEEVARKKSEDEDSRFVAAAGKKFVATMMLWLPAGREDEDNDFNPLDQFREEDQPANKIQGALRDLYAVLLQEYRDLEDSNGWIPVTFTTGMNDQHSFTAMRLCHHPDLFDCTTRQLLLQENHHKFCEQIGYKQKQNKPTEQYYDTVNVPLLHADYQGKYDANKIFLGPFLFIIHAAITLGLASVAAMKENHVPPKVQSVAQLWGLQCTTPGMIAAAAIWGLTKKKPTILNIFRVWDNKFYPNSDEGLANGVDSDDEGEEGQQVALEEMNAEDIEPDDDD